MDLQKTGAFIAQCRRARGLTQSQLAAHLAVTDKAVSRWECGRGFPDPATLPALAEALGVTVTELVNGESAASETQESAEAAILSALRYVGGLRRKTLGAVLLTAGLLSLFYSVLVVGVSTLVFYVLAAALLAAGAGLLWRAKHPAKALRVLSPKAARVGALLTLAAAFALECLPHGFEMRWATPPGEPPHITYCAYFSLLPAGYGNIFPLFTALATAALLVAALAALARNRPLGRRVFVGGVLALLFSLAGLLLLGALTPIGWGISLLLLASLALQALGGRNTLTP